MLADHRPVRDDGPRPATGHQAGGLGGPGEAADQDGRAGAVRPQREHLAGVRVRCAGLGVQVVAVIPENHQSQVADRREHGGAGAGHHPRPAAADGQPAPVALGGPEVRGQRDVPAGTELGGEGRVEQAEIAGVGDHGQGAPPGRRDAGHRPGDLLRPVRAGQRRPHGARSPAAGQGVEERGAVRVPGPRAGPGRPGRAIGAPGRGGHGSRFGAGVPGRDSQPQHVGQGACAAVRDFAGQGHDLRAQHGLG